MLYALICYGDEGVDGALTPEQDAAMIGRIEALQQKWAAAGRSGPSVRLMPTTAATTLRAGREPVLIDGPFAETKEQLLGIWVIDCGSFEQALEAGRAWAREKPSGSLEIRPLRSFTPGSAAPA